MGDDAGIAAIGECMLELSAAGGGQWRIGFAGDTFNTLWAMRALLPNAGIDYVTAFGDDPFSKDQIEFLKEHGIGTASSPTIADARPGLYAITLDGAERSFTYWRSDSAARQLASDPAALTKSVSNLRLAYFSGITLAILDETERQTLLQTIGEARSAGTLVAFDPNYRPGLWPSRESAQRAFGKALEITDIALPTFPDEQDLYGDTSPEQTLERLAATGVREIVVKNGTGNALVLSDEQILEVPPRQVDNPVDTTGAGDAFNGGYLAARLLGLRGPEAARKAHCTAAAVVRVYGALAPFEFLHDAFED